MSRINDALKQARKAPPRNTPSAMPTLPPVADEPSPVFAWLFPAVVILLIVAAIFFIGWAMAHHTLHTIATAPEITAAQQADIQLPVIAPHPVEAAPPPAAPDLPKLQGIFYSPTTPTAILDGKTVAPGDQFGIYRVKSISKYTVTIVGPDQKEIQIGMAN